MMERVNIPDEAPGSATYYMGFAPEEYGVRLYDMERYDGAVIQEALMDIGPQRTEPHKVIASYNEYSNLIWKSENVIVYSCRFEVDYKDIHVTVLPDFITKRLTLQVTPGLNQEEKKQLAEFFEILTEPDYYEEKELEEINKELQIPLLFKRLAIAAGATIVILSTLKMTGILPTSPNLLDVLDLAAWLFLGVYWVWIAIKKRQLKKRREGNER
ncbi:MAG: hypothetical protein IJL99_01015 [Firmicutes bacterium]|nr:hypothetical protein [Bacillota bacterium]